MSYMTEYRCAYVPGALWFFTVNLAERNNNDLLLRRIDDSRGAFRYVKQKHSFQLCRVQ